MSKLQPTCAAKGKNLLCVTLPANLLVRLQAHAREERCTLSEAVAFFIAQGVLTPENTSSNPSLSQAHPQELRDVGATGNSLLDKPIDNNRPRRSADGR